MIVECGQCSTRFKIADEKITPRGVKVRCSKCKHMFVVKKEGAVDPAVSPGATPGSKTPHPPPAADGPTMRVRFPDGAVEKEGVFKAPTKVAPQPPPAGTNEANTTAKSAGSELDDVFSKPTKVGPPPVPGAEPSGKFPVPAPPVPGGGSKSLADQIDLDGDDFDLEPMNPPLSAQMAAQGAKPSPVPPPPPPPAPPRVPTPPKVAMPPKVPAPGAQGSAGKASGQVAPLPPPPVPPSATKTPPKEEAILGEDLFGDLSALESEKKPPPTSTPSTQTPPAAAAGDPFAPPSPGPGAAPASAFSPAPTIDDPFAGIDISDGPAASPAPAKSEPPQPGPPPPSDPVSGEAVGKPTEDLFGDLGDPFAELSPSPGSATQPAEQEASSPFGDLPADDPPTPGLIGPESSGLPAQDDPFASIDTTASPGPNSSLTGGVDSSPFGPDPFSASGPPGTGDDFSSGMTGQLMDNDPFGQLDSGGGQAGEQPSGLQLDEDGHLTGEDLPSPPPPSKTLSTLNADEPSLPAPAPAPAAPMAPLATEPPRSSGSLWIYKIGFGVVALLMALLLFVAYRSGGKPDLTSWSTYVEAFTGESAAVEIKGELQAVKVNNTAYPNRDGHPLVVVWGQVENPTEKEKKAIAVVAKLVDKKGKVRGEMTVPAGIEFTPLEVYSMHDESMVAAAYHDRLAKVADLTVAPGGKIPFMLVFYEHPDKMDGMEFLVQPMVSDDPMRGLPSPSSPDLEDAGDEENDEEDAEEPPPESTPAKAIKGKTAGAASPPKAGGKTGGVVVKKQGTFVRMKPASGESGEEKP